MLKCVHVKIILSHENGDLSVKQVGLSIIKYYID